MERESQKIENGYSPIIEISDVSLSRFAAMFI